MSCFRSKIFSLIDFTLTYLTLTLCVVFTFSIIPYYLYKSYSLNQPINIGEIGTFLGGMAAFLAIFWVRAYWIKERAQAAARVLVIYSQKIGYISEIIGNPAQFQFEGYYPNEIPEVPQENAKSFSQRPNRLLCNAVGSLKNECSAYLPIIGGKEMHSLIDLEAKLQKVCNQACGLIQGILGNHPSRDAIVAVHKDNKEYIQDLKNILSQVRELLTPLIKKG